MKINVDTGMYARANKILPHAPTSTTLTIHQTVIGGFASSPHIIQILHHAKQRLGHIMVVLSDHLAMCSFLPL